LYLHGFIPSCRRPFAEGRVSVADHSCPPDFGPPQAGEFFRPLDNKKDFPPPDLNFFTASPIKGEGRGEGEKFKYLWLGFRFRIYFLPGFVLDFDIGICFLIATI